MRVSLGLSQTEWSVILHVHPMTLWRWERGRKMESGLYVTLYTRLARVVATQKPRVSRALGAQLRSVLALQGPLAALQAVTAVALRAEAAPLSNPGEPVTTLPA